MSSTLESVYWIKVSTITCYVVLYWFQITFFLEFVHYKKWLFICRVFMNSKWDYEACVRFPKKKKKSHRNKGILSNIPISSQFYSSFSA